MFPSRHYSKLPKELNIKTAFRTKNFDACSSNHKIQYLTGKITCDDPKGRIGKIIVDAGDVGKFSGDVTPDGLGWKLELYNSQNGYHMYGNMSFNDNDNSGEAFLMTWYKNRINAHKKIMEHFHKEFPLFPKAKNKISPSDLRPRDLYFSKDGEPETYKDGYRLNALLIIMIYI